MTDAVRAAVAAATDADVRSAEPVRGGDVNEAFRVELADGRSLFVKHQADAPAGAFRAEAGGLEWLAEAAALRLPQVVAVGEEEEPRFLALEWIPSGPPAPDHDERLGRGLAELHRAGAPGFGAAADGWIASLPQANGARPTWAEFYAEQRLEPLVRAAVDRGLLPRGTGRRAGRLIDRVDDLAGPPESPARLHGDLWAGNALADTDGRPVLVDPAAYGGHREVDLAMMRLFGGFSEAVHRHYDDAFPLAPGHADRVLLYQLYPLLVHVLLFGATYVARAERVIARYVGRG